MTALDLALVASLLALAATLLWHRRRLRAAAAAAAAASAAPLHKFAVPLPEELRGEPAPAEGQLNFLRFWQDHGKTPGALLRAAAVPALERLARENPTAIGPGMPMWSLLATGFPDEAPSDLAERQRLVAVCRECGELPAPIGAIELGGTGEARVTVRCCPCGNGFAIWRHDKDLAVQSVVLALRAGPRAGDVRIAVAVPPRPEPPLPPAAFVLVGGRLAGQLSLLRDRLIFTNDVALTVSPAAHPLELSPDGLDGARAFVTENLAEIVEAMREVETNLDLEETIWDLAGRARPAPWSEPVEDRDAGTRGPAPGEAPTRPILCFEPAGERRYLNNLQCPRGRSYRYVRTGSCSGSCPDPATHRSLERRGKRPAGEPEGVLVDRYELRCACGEHSKVVYFDMYHPPAASD